MSSGKYILLVFVTLVSFTYAGQPKQQNHRLFKAIYKNQLQYLKDSIPNKMYYERIIKFGERSREKIYASNGIGLDDRDNYIILEGVSDDGGVLTGILFKNGKAFSYKVTGEKGWQFSMFNVSDLDSLSYYSYMGKTEIEKVRDWDIQYISKLKSMIGATSVHDGFNFIATRIDDARTSSPKIETVGFGQFNPNF